MSGESSLTPDQRREAREIGAAMKPPTPQEGAWMPAVWAVEQPAQLAS